MNLDHRQPVSAGTVRLLIVAAASLILLLPTPAGMTPAAHRLVAVAFVMAAFWVSQTIPLAVTSLLPLALFPLLAIRTPDEVSGAYANDTLFLYLGGMLIALGIERWNLHRRIALTLVSAIGVSPRRLVLGFLVTSALLSMWISNTACTLMMLPIASALLRILDETHSSSAGSANDSSGSEKESSRVTSSFLTRIRSVPGRSPTDRFGDDAGQIQACGTVVLLAIAYGASLGGMTTLVGTPTNSAAVGIYYKHMSTAQEISVAQWLLACGPIGAIYLLVVWFVLTRRLRPGGPQDAMMLSELTSRRAALGRASTAERRMFLMFLLTAALWIFRRPLQLGTITVLPGWQDAWQAGFDHLARIWNPDAAPFPSGKSISDTTVAMLLATLLFVVPSGTRDEQGQRVALMDWSTAVRLPWDIILLFGGGFAIAEAFEATGLSEWLGQALHGPLAGQPPWLVIAVVCLLMTFLTELTSNVATVSALTPAIISLAAAIDLDARLLFIPATLAASCAFMLPIATPPNAIVFGSGRISMRQMARYGIVLNLIGVPILTAGTLLIIRHVLQIP